MQIIIAVLILVALAWLGWRWNTAPRVLYGADSPAPDFPASGFSHDGFEALLNRFVNPQGEVDYQAWHDDQQAQRQLDEYLAAIALYTPDTAPTRFADRNEQMAFWVYAYNAFVIKGVLSHWPLQSVTDLKAPIEVVKGLGFFYNLRFIVGGRRMSLYDLEHSKILRPFKDPRAHFVLNCASGSCPLIPTQLKSGDEFDLMLDEAAQAFITDERNVRVNHDTRQIELNNIFHMYTSDFVNHLRQLGLPTQRGVVDYIASIAPEALGQELARATGYKTIYREYDWSINTQAS